MSNIINLALQILPMHHAEAIPIIDRAIETIQQSGLSYLVCPFETVIEGEYDAVMDLVKRVQMVCFEAGANELIVNIKIHHFKNQSAHIADKVGKYRAGK